MKKYSSKKGVEEQVGILEEPEAVYASSVSVDRGDCVSEDMLRKIIDPERMRDDQSEYITAEELLVRLAPKIKAMFE